MKKTNISLLVFSMLCAIYFAAVFSGCKFNFSETKYLTRPDVELTNNGFRINGNYISNDIKYINIYRQDVSQKNNVVRIAVLFPKGDPTPDNQNFYFEDTKVYKNHTYQYYVRFVSEKGEKNRTEWSEKKLAKNVGAETSAKFYYDVNTASYEYDSVNHIFTLKNGTINAPSNTAIPDIDKYVPALVFQSGDDIRVFELAAPNTISEVNLKTVLPVSFFNTPVKLLGIVGQKTEKNTAVTPSELQSITWTELASINLIDKATGGKIENQTITVEVKYGASEGFDYSTISDNED